MFSDVPGADLSFESTWKKVRQSKNTHVQTEHREYSEIESQTAISLFQTTATTENEVQTQHFTPSIEMAFKIGDQWIYGDPKKALLTNEPSEGAEGADDSITEDIPIVDQPMLDFLEKVGPDLLAQLELNDKSSAFDGHDVNWEDEATNVSAIHTLTPTKPCDLGLQVTGVTWNSNGSVIAVSYGRIDVVGWCYEKGYVCTWNVLRGDVNPTKPDLCIEVDNYVMSLAFHPDEPSLLVGGTYNGEVMVWNTTAEEDSLMAQSASSLSTSSIQHTDPIHNIMWVANKREQKVKYVILSVSGDGKILLWNLNNLLNSPVGGYEISGKKGGAVGCTAIGVLHNIQGGISVKKEPPSLESTVLVATEAGNVYKTSIKPASIMEGASAKSTQVRVTLNDPVNFKYEVHHGPVQQLHCSPFHRNLFLTASSDGSVKMYNANETGRIHSVTPSSSVDSYIYDAAWSPVRPFVFACVSKDSYLYIYDLEESRIKPVCTIQAGSEGAAVLSLAFNAASKEYLATGDAQGHVRVWRLSHALSAASPHEAAVLGAKKAETKNKLWFKYTTLVL